MPLFMENVVHKLKLIKKRMSKKSLTVRIKKVLLFYCILLCMPVNLYAEEPEFYTIQTGSFVDIKSAQKQFDSIVKGLNEQELSFFRIELCNIFKFVIFF